MKITPVYSKIKLVMLAHLFFAEDFYIPIFSIKH